MSMERNKRRSSTVHPMQRASPRNDTLSWTEPPLPSYTCCVSHTKAPPYLNTHTHTHPYADLIPTHFLSVYNSAGPCLWGVYKITQSCQASKRKKWQTTMEWESRRERDYDLYQAWRRLIERGEIEVGDLEVGSEKWVIWDMRKWWAGKTSDRRWQ